MFTQNFRRCVPFLPVIMQKPEWSSVDSMQALKISQFNLNPLKIWRVPCVN
jgi:hypothetical protein